MGQLSILGGDGDTKLIWDAGNEAEVENAKRTFKDLMKKGFLAYAVKGKSGAKDEQIFDFDPDEERIILSPPLIGG